MMPSFQAPHILVLLILGLCVKESVGSDQFNVNITVKDGESRTSFIFLGDSFRKFYECLCRVHENCTALFPLRSRQNAYTYPTDHTIRPGNASTQNLNPALPYNCETISRRNRLSCTCQKETYNLCQRCVGSQSFYLKNVTCDLRFVTLVWFYPNESITVNTGINSALEIGLCDDPTHCPSPTIKIQTPLTLSLSTASTSTSINNNNNSSTTFAGITPNDDEEDNDNVGVIAGVIVAVLVIAVIVVIVVVWWKRRKKKEKKLYRDQHLNDPASAGLIGLTSTEGPASSLNSRPSETAETSPREQSQPAPSSDPQIEYSQLDTQDPNTYEHAYAALSTSPYYNSKIDITANTTKAPKSGTLNNTSTSAYSNMATSTPNSRQAYSNTSGPDPTGNSSSAYYSSPTSSTECPSQQRNSYISIIGEPDTEAVYSQADVPYSTVTGDYINRKP